MASICECGHRFKSHGQPVVTADGDPRCTDWACDKCNCQAYYPRHNIASLIKELERKNKRIMELEREVDKLKDDVQYNPDSNDF